MDMRTSDDAAAAAAAEMSEETN